MKEQEELAGLALPKSMADALLDLADEMQAQDNAATAWPIFIVQRRCRIHWFDSQLDHLDFEWMWSDEPGFFCSDDDVQGEIRREQADLRGVPLDEIPEDYRDPRFHGWERVYYEDRWEYVCAHFTRRAAEAYIEQNKHNLRPEARVFVHSQHRCQEWQMVVRALMELAK